MTETVTVVCKLPHGLVLQLQEPLEKNEPGSAGFRTVTEWRRVGDTVTLKGFAHRADRAPDGQIIGGFALTHGVDAAFFAAWMAQNARHPAVERGFIYAATKPGMAEGHARSLAKEVSGLEPVDPAALPQEFRASVATTVR